MANNYSEAAGLISAEQVLAPDRILRFFRAYESAWENACAWQAGWPFHLDSGSQGFSLELAESGDLYWRSEDYFEVESFARFMRQCIKNGWLKGPIHGTSCWFCDKPRPDEFGGLYVRITSEDYHIISTNLRHLPDEAIQEMELLANPFLKC